MSSTWPIANRATRGKPLANARGTVTRARARSWTVLSWDGWPASVRTMWPISWAMRPEAIALSAACNETWIR